MYRVNDISGLLTVSFIAGTGNDYHPEVTLVSRIISIALSVFFVIAIAILGTTTTQAQTTCTVYCPDGSTPNVSWQTPVSRAGFLRRHFRW